MSRYRRAKIDGGTFFFTLALADRKSDLLVRHIDRLRRSYAIIQKRLPFETVAICILPDHLHALWQLPEGDADFASRWSRFKSAFSRGVPASAARSASKIAKREKGIWQRRYWEHAIRDDADLERHVAADFCPLLGSRMLTAFAAPRHHAADWHNGNQRGENKTQRDIHESHGDLHRCPSASCDMRMRRIAACKAVRLGTRTSVVNARLPTA
jgi:putative transposase